MKALASSTDSTLPKLELAVMRMYLSMLTKVRRPSSTPWSSTMRFFSSRMMSAASLAMSTAVSTEMPMSATCSAAASLMPSPRYPTTWPLPLSRRTMRSLCAGVSLANTVVVSATAASRASSSASMSEPSSTLPGARPTSWQILAVTASLSPVRIFTVMPWLASAASAGAVVSLGGSRKAT
ncbi:MAG: hypothetical protein BWX79_01810 [Alphaproteobacteria bacterium ADurb.Bin100]|nr:MAG: hypothetical protein BWX79_01810 [Alphaproteobacteria bacterium ADurb.Bin100]